jgi:hypothetical protein
VNLRLKKTHLDSLKNYGSKYMGTECILTANWLILFNRIIAISETQGTIKMRFEKAQTLLRLN